MALLPPSSRVLGPGAGAPLPPLAAVPWSRPLRLGGTSVGRAVRLSGPVAACLVLAAQAVAPQTVAALSLPIAVAGVVIGVPHGAADHLAPFWAARRPVRRPLLSLILAGYGAGVAVSLAAVAAAPVATLWAFLLVSALHFGRGEVVVQAELAGRRPPGLLHDLPAALAHGAVTVAVPLALHPATSTRLLDPVAPGFAATAPAVLTALAVGAIGLVVLGLAALSRERRYAEALELLLLLALFALVPAPVAFGVYFGLWHALRHTMRLVVVAGSADSSGTESGTESGSGIGPRVWRTGLRRYLVAALLPSLVAAGLLGVLLRATTPTVLAAALVLLVGLTSPHLVVVADLDRRLAHR